MVVTVGTRWTDARRYVRAGMLVAVTAVFAAPASAGPTPESLLESFAASAPASGPVTADIEVIHGGAWYTPCRRRFSAPSVQRRTWSAIYIDDNRIVADTRNHHSAQSTAADWIRSWTRLEGDSWYRYAEWGPGAERVAAARYEVDGSRTPAHAIHAFWGLELLGFAPGTRTPLASHLAAMPRLVLRARVEAVQGHPCAVLEVSGPDETWRLWIDPDAGGLPRRIEATITWRGESEVRARLEAAGVTVPPEFQNQIARPVRLDFVMEDILIATPEDRPAIQRARVCRTVRLANGAFYRTLDQMLASGVWSGARGPTPLPAPGIAAALDGGPGNAVDAGLASFSFDVLTMPRPAANARLAAPAPPPTFVERCVQAVLAFRMRDLRDRDPHVLLGWSAGLAIAVNLGVAVYTGWRPGARGGGPRSQW